MRALVALLLFTSVLTRAQDWPQFLGPDRNGSYPERLSTNWPASGPRQLWRKSVGEGFAAPVISQGRLILFHRVADREQLLCLDPATGEQTWKYEYPATYDDDFGFEAGPRATPAISGDEVFAMGADGVISSVNLASGARIWQVDARKQFSAQKGFFGMACSPLVEGGLVLLNIGGADGAGIVALERASGKLRWKATGHEASYSAPITAAINGAHCAFFFTREGLVMLDPKDGSVLAQKPWRARMHASVNAAAPLFIPPDRLFLTASYGVGGLLLQIDPPQVKTLWEKDSLSSHYASVVHHAGHIYGFDGRQEHGPDFVCVKAANGEVAWRKQQFGAGTVLLAGDQLVILKESGELVLAPASPAAFTILAQAQLFGETRAYPAIAQGRLYARDKKELRCYDLAK